MKKLGLGIMLVLALLPLSACKAKEEAPKLIAPVAENESVRFVERGDVYDEYVALADVCGEEYCHFLINPAEIASVNVDVGQYVHEGDVLATIDTSALELEYSLTEANLDRQNRTMLLAPELNDNRITCAENDLESARRSLQSLQTAQSIRDEALKDEPDMEIGDEESELLDYSAKKATEAVKNAETNLSVTRENASFDVIMANHRAAVATEELAKISKKIDDGTIRAKHDGYVTYLKDLSNSNSVNAYENIVIVTDVDTLHLELNETLDSMLYKNTLGRMKEIFVLIGNKNCPVTVHEYTNAEYSAMEAAGMFTRIRLDLEVSDDMSEPDAGGLANSGDTVKSGDTAKSADSAKYGGSLKSGDKLPVYMRGEGASDVLYIGADSLYKDNDKAWVYVDEDNSRKKREITIGLESEDRVEVTSGLSEGEAVYYTSAEVIPSNYKTMTLAPTDYVPNGNNLGLTASIDYTSSVKYMQKDRGKVHAINVSQGDTVEPGTLLCEIDVNEGESLNKDLNNSLVEVREGYLEYVAESDKAISELREDKSHEKTEEGKRRIDERIALIKSEQINAAIDYEYNSRVIELKLADVTKRADEDGIRRVYATSGGVVERIDVVEDRTVALSDTEELMTVSDASSAKICVRTGEEYIGYGNTVEFRPEAAGETVFTTTVIGNGARQNVVNLAYFEDKPYVTCSISDEGNNLAYTELPDGMEEKVRTLKAFYSVSTLRDVIVVPKRAVYEEIKRGTTITDYYVWREVNGRLVKTYINTEESINTSTEICVLSGLKAGDVIAIEENASEVSE